jgi:hypothetical protein
LQSEASSGWPTIEGCQLEAELLIPERESVLGNIANLLSVVELAAYLINSLPL